MSNQISNTEFTRRREAATPRGVGVMCNFYADRADNAELWDIEGNRYIDFASGIAVLHTRHTHPRLLRSIDEQLKPFTHTTYHTLPSPRSVDLATQTKENPP